MMERYVFMGVSGCGKSSIGAAFAAQIGAVFVDGDDLHPAANITKMAQGIPLDDGDRAPWLAIIGQRFNRATMPLGIACSSLKRKYRDTIRKHAGGPVIFVHLQGRRDVIAQRISARTNHFMPAGLLDSQFAALEDLQADEHGFCIDIDQQPEEIVSTLVAHFEKDKS